MIATLVCAVWFAANSASSQLPDWIKGWHEALRRSSKVQAHVVILSDSTAKVDQTNGPGYGPNERSNLWPSQLRTTLDRIAPGRAQGSGMLALEGNAARIDTDIWQVPGRYTYNATIGPFEAELDHGQVPSNGGTVLLATGQTAKLGAQYGDTLWIYWANCPDSSPFEVVVDGKTQGNFGDKVAGSCTAQRTRAFHGKLGNHELSIKSSLGNVYLYAAEWTVGHGGIAVDNLAVGGATTTFFDNSAKLAYLHTIPNLGLAILALGINDFLHATSIEEYRANLSNIVRDIRQHFPQGSILILNQYRVINDGHRNRLGALQSEYARAAQEVANDEHVGFLDVAEAWGSFSAQSGRGLLTSDTVHPSDLGGKELSCVAARAILSASDNPCPSNR